MTLAEAQARVRVAISRLEGCSDRHLIEPSIREGYGCLEDMKPGRFSEAEVIQDLLKVSARLHDFADKIAGIRGRISA